jgi:hypothetical protein
VESPAATIVLPEHMEAADQIFPLWHEDSTFPLADCRMETLLEIVPLSLPNCAVTAHPPSDACHSLRDDAGRRNRADGASLRVSAQADPNSVEQGSHIFIVGIGLHHGAEAVSPPLLLPPSSPPALMLGGSTVADDDDGVGEACCRSSRCGTLAELDALDAGMGEDRLTVAPLEPHVPSCEAPKPGGSPVIERRRSAAAGRLFPRLEGCAF